MVLLLRGFVGSICHGLWSCDISVKELVPVTIAAALWDKQWSTDDMAVIISPPSCIYCICISLFSAFYGFYFCARHVSGVLNKVADVLSRNKADHISSFYLTGPQVPLYRSTSQAAHLGETRLGLSVLDGIGCQLTDSGVAEPTKKMYESGQCRFLSFCRQFALNPLPASEAPRVTLWPLLLLLGYLMGQ